jgi:hypothetical protein
MSKTIVILLGLCLVWLTAWTIAGYFMREAGTEKLVQSEHVSTPATRLERGAEVRVEGTIVEGPPVAAPYSQEPCLAGVAHVSVVGRYRDSQDRETSSSSHVATLRVGPPSLEIAVGDERIELPLERWVPREYSAERMAELPAHLGVTREAIDRAKESLRGSYTGLLVSESTIEGGTRFFVVGRLEDRDGPLRLEADRVLERVELYPGSQDELRNELRGSGSGLVTAGWILGAGLGPLPLAILGAILLVRRRKRSATTVAGPPYPHRAA